MVSTRGLRYKFSEGERVLCYEPDPTKAKVLYDSKVLEVIESKDKRGRRTVEYLIHFQGWNSSWDRCVSEDFVLKDTEENRQLQRDLAEKSQLQLGAYLYRRERKKGSTSSAGGGPAKRGRPGLSDDGSSTSTQPDEGETGDTDSSSGSRSGSPPPAHAGRAHIALPSALRDRLTFDYHLVVKRGRLSRLPASPSAAHILESFVKWFARAGAWNPAPAPAPPRAKHDAHAHAQHKPDMLDVSCRLNLVREIADGLRVYFDFILRGHLLYKQEQAQYHEMCGMYFNDGSGGSGGVKSEGEESQSQSQEEEALEQQLADDLKSPTEYSHLPPDPAPANTHNGEQIIEIKQEPQENSNSGDATDKFETNGKVEVKREVDSEPMVEVKSEPRTDDGNEESNELIVDVKVELKAESKSDSAPEDCSLNNGTDKRKVRSATRIATRRLRSHKSAVSQSESEEPAPSTSAAEPRVPDPHSSSAGSSGGSSLGEGWPTPPAPPAPPTVPTRTPLSLLLDKVSKWQIIPKEESTEKLPCRVYGAIHLARLFVKLPDFLNAAQMPDFKLKLVLKHIDMFVQYLDEHSEWFGEMYYIADSVSRSH